MYPESSNQEEGMGGGY